MCINTNGTVLYYGIQQQKNLHGFGLREVARAPGEHPRREAAEPTVATPRCPAEEEGFYYS